MNETITSREELLLAKLAGKNVNISTMTPPVAMNKREKLLLDIAERLDGFNGCDGGAQAGSGSMVVTLSENDGTWTSDTEVADITSAFNNGVPVFIYVEDVDVMSPVMHASHHNDTYTIVAPATAFLPFGEIMYTSWAIAMYTDNEWTVNAAQFTRDISSFSIIPATATVGDSGGKTTFTFSSLLAIVAYEQISAGKKFKVSVTINGDDIEAIFNVEAVKKTSNGTVTYSFRFVNEYGIGFSASNLSGSDTLVLTEE